MRTTDLRNEKGQTLVWVALIMIALLTFLAMATDIGMIYFVRRHMQNAADAGALAGARELCLGGSEADAAAVAEEYAVTRNLAEHAAIAVRENTVTVIAERNVRLFFWGPTGYSNQFVPATATAACGRVTTACGLWPVAFDVEIWEFLYLSCASNPEFIVWNDEKTDLDCDRYDCDIDDDGRDDIIVGGDRGWLDLSAPASVFVHDCTQPGCGSAELSCLIRSNSGGQLNLGEDGICISGSSGVKAGVHNAVDSRRGDTVAIPLYDYIGCTEPNGNCPGGLGYHIISVGCVTVSSWEHSIQLRPIDPEDHGPPITGKGILVRLDCTQNCMSDCGGTDGTPALPWEYKAVSLIE